MLNVYAIKASGNYGGGCAIVAHNTPELAIRQALAIRDTLWKTDYSVPNEVTLLEGVQADGEPRVLTHYEMGE